MGAVKRVGGCKITMAWMLVGICTQGCSDNPRDRSALKASRAGTGVAFANLVGDGVPDMLVGAPGAQRSAGRTGAVLAYEGRQDGSFAESPVEVWGASAYEAFGGRVVNVGDLDGGGVDDVAISAVHADGDVPLSGTVTIHWGEDPTRTLRLRGQDPREQFGQAVAAGDFDGDGRRDLAVGAFRSSAGAPLGGAVYLFYGGPGMDAEADRVLTSSHVNHALGTALLGTDLNGDGVDDLVVAGHGEYVEGFFGASEITWAADAADVRFLGYPSDFDATGARHLASSFGEALANLGDLNGDGYDELAIANPKRSVFDKSDFKGVVYVYRGGPVLVGDVHPDDREADPGLQDSQEVQEAEGIDGGVGGGDAGDAGGGQPVVLATLVGHRNLDRFGHAVRNLGDLDGGGVDDFAVGAPWSSAGLPTAGAVYVFLGEHVAHASSALDAAATLVGERPGAHFGYAFAHAGTAPQGAHELWIGAPEQDLRSGAIHRGSIALDPSSTSTETQGGTHDH